MSFFSWSGSSPGSKCVVSLEVELELDSIVGKGGAYSAVGLNKRPYAFFHNSVYTAFRFPFSRYSSTRGTFTL